MIKELIERGKAFVDDIRRRVDKRLAEAEKKVVCNAMQERFGAGTSSK